MGYARYIGRVGALAVALGVGAAVATTPGVALAQDGEGSAPNNTETSQEQSNPNPDPGSEAQAPSEPSGSDPAGGEQEAEGESAQEAPGSAVTVDLGDGVVVSSSGGSIEPAEEADQPEQTAEPQPSAEPAAPAEPPTGGESDEGTVAPTTNAPQVVVGGGTAPASGAPVEPSVVVVDPTPSPQAPAEALTVASDSSDAPALDQVSAREPVTESAATPADVVTGVLATLLSPFASTDPNAPVDSPVMWVLAAAARRQFGLAAESREAVTLGVTGDVDASLMTTSAALVVEVDAVLGVPDPTTGAVSGVVVPPDDPAGRRPTYTLTSPPAEGSLTFNRSTGAFTYTPTAAQRVIAGLTAEEETVDFTVSVRYSWNGTPSPVTVSVPVSPTPIADVGDVQTGEGALGVAVTNNRAYVVNGDDGTVSVVDTINRVKITDVAVGDLPQGVVVTPDGKKVYVSNMGSNSISVIDTASNTVTSTIDLEDRSPQLMAISPNGRTLYVTTAVVDPEDENLVLSSQITKISTTTNRVTGSVRNVGLVPYAIAVSPNGSKIYVISEIESEGDYQSGVFVFSSYSGTARQIAGVGTQPESLIVSPDSTKLYVGDWDTGTISVVDTRNYQVIDSFTTAPETVDELAVNKDGTLLMVLNADTHAVDVYDTRTGDFELLHSVPTNATTELNFPEAALSPDGMELYFSSDGALQIISLVPPNTRPERAGEVVDDPNSAGVVTGEVGVVDADDDLLTYTVTGAPGKGKVVVNDDGTFTYTPTAAARHAASADDADPALLTDRFTVTVDDGRRGIVTEEITVDVLPANADPTFRVSSPAPSWSTGLVRGSVTGRDADRDALTYDVVGATEKGGTVTIDERGRFVYTPSDAARHAAAATGAPDALKTDSFTVAIDDGHGGTVDVPVTVRIRPANARPDNAAVTLGSPNDDGAVIGTVTATDADNDDFALSGPTSTSKGSITYDSATDTFTYTPTLAARQAASNPRAGSWTKTDTFTVTVNDGHGGTDTVRVRVTIAELDNENPVNGEFDTDAPTANGTVAGNVTADDPDDDPLTYSGPASGLSAKGAAVIVESDGDFTYTPTAAMRHAASANGIPPEDRQDTFTVTVSDGNGGTLSVPVTVDISPANAAPVGSFSAGQPDSSSGLVTGTVTSTDTDGDTRTYGGPASGLSTHGGTVSVNTATGVFNYTPSAAARQAASGTPGTDVDTFTVTVNDGHGGTDDVEVTVTIAPAVAENQDPENGDFTTTAPTLNGTVTGVVTADDPDDDPLSFSGPVSGLSAKGGTVSVQSNGDYSYTPTAAMRHAASANGLPAEDRQDTFDVVVSDGRGGELTVTVTVDIDPTNAAPEGSYTAEDPNSTTGLVEGDVDSTDAEGDIRTYSAPATSVKGGTVTINSATGQFTYTPSLEAREDAAETPGADIDTFVVTINDGHLGGTDTLTVEVDIAPAEAVVPGVPNPAAVNGFGNGPIIIGTTGAKYQLMLGGLNPITGSPEGPVKVQVITPAGDQHVVTVGGQPLSYPTVAPNGNVHVVTYDLDSETVNIATITPTGGMTVKSVTGTPASPLMVTEDGAAYLATAVLNEADPQFQDVTVTRVTANGVSDSETFTGAANNMVLSADDVYYHAYIGTDGLTRVLIIRPDGSTTTTSPIGTADSSPGAVSAGTNGTAYLSRYDEGVTKVDVVDAVTGAVITHDLDGTPAGKVVVAPNGTAYQVQRDIDGDGNAVTYVAVVTTGGATPTEPVIGEPPFGPETIKVADNGTGYLLVNDSGAYKVVVVSPSGGATAVDVPDSTGEASGIYISPDNKAYVVGNSTVTVVTPAAGVTEIDIDGQPMTNMPIVFSADGAHAYVAVEDDDGAYLQNLVTGAKSAEVANDVGFAQVPTIESIAVGADGTGRLILARADLTKVEILTLAASGPAPAPMTFTGTTEAVLPVGVAAGPDGATYVTIFRINIGTSAGTTTIVKLDSAGSETVATLYGIPAGPAAIGTDGLVYQTVNLIAGMPPNTLLITETHVVDPSAPANAWPTSGSFTAGEPDSNGVVQGSVSATDADDAQLIYVGTQTTPTGSLVVQSNGSYAYTPTEQARHAASINGAPPEFTQNTFTIIALDGRGGALPITVTVDISPFNEAPVGSFEAGEPDVDSGVVEGTVTSTDADGDLRTYSGPTVSAKGGEVTVQSDGQFTYTPTAEMRAAAAGTESDDTDTFEVTINDGHLGGTSTVTVTVSVSPFVEGANRAPRHSAAVTVGQPDFNGDVSGNFNVFDPDGDAVFFTIEPSGANSELADGFFRLDNATGAWTFSPTEARKREAAQPTGARPDEYSFTWKADDGQGGILEGEITVAIAPTNQWPRAANHQQTTNPTTGLVVGTFDVVDPDDDYLEVSLVGEPQYGDFAFGWVGGSTFQYSYAPSADRFPPEPEFGSYDENIALVLSDGKGGQEYVGIYLSPTPPTAPVLPEDIPPSSGITSTRPANTATGAVNGAVSYSASGSWTYTAGPASKGSVTIDSATGEYTYTPDPEARTEAGNPGATPQTVTDKFVVTVKDGAGTTVAEIPVTVPISAVYVAPDVSVVLDAVNPNTGVVKGSLVNANSGQTLYYYRQSSATPLGAVKLNSDGTFVYTPKLAARIVAAEQPNVQDVFAITVIDEFNRMTAVRVVVPVAPALPPTPPMTNSPGVPSAPPWEPQPEPTPSPATLTDLTEMPGYISDGWRFMAGEVDNGAYSDVSTFEGFVREGGVRNAEPWQIGWYRVHTEFTDRERTSTYTLTGTSSARAVDVYLVDWAYDADRGESVVTGFRKLEVGKEVEYSDTLRVMSDQHLVEAQSTTDYVTYTDYSYYTHKGQLIFTGWDEFTVTGTVKSSTVMVFDAGTFPEGLFPTETVDPNEEMWNTQVVPLQEAYWAEQKVLCSSGGGALQTAGAITFYARNPTGGRLGKLPGAIRILPKNNYSEAVGEVQTLLAPYCDGD